MRRWKKKLLPITLSIAIASSVISPGLASALGSFDLHSTFIQTPINEYQADLAPGIVEKHYSFEGKDGKKIESFVVDVDMQNASTAIEAGTPNDGTAYGLQPVRQQAKAADGENHKVVAAVNADFYNMATGEPIGIVYKDGQAVKAQNGSSHKFFGIKKSGEAVIGDAAEYEGMKDQLKEALGGNAILVKNSKIYQTPQTGADKEPRTAVGIKADGDVFFVVIDGRQEPYSAGISMPDLAQLMIDLGAVQALNLDGGGSSTFTTRELGGDNLEVDNLPSDRSERSVANTWLVVTKEPSDRVFESAYIAPYDQSFTPGSAISFTAKGRDKSMASAPLPASGLTWELSDPSFGTIDGNGQFLSSGKTGQFDVIVKYQGKEVGKSIVEIARPDEMSFFSKELTAAKNSTVDLILSTNFQKRNVKWNTQDIEFEIPEGMGTIDASGVLHTGEKSVSGNITARLKGTDLTAQIKVSVGKLPEVLFDFENGLGGWKSTVVGRGEKAAVSLSSFPEPVRFGDQALKMDFDLSNAQTGTTLGAYAGPGSNIDIPDNPTSFGMWVYATPEAQGYWLRMNIVDGKGKTQTIDLNNNVPGIDWTGWKYIEAEIPSAFTGPYKLSGTQAIRLMSTNSGKVGPMTKGTIYIDNIRAVYGEKVDDLYPPVIQSINVDGKDFTTNAVNLKADVTEYEDDPFKTGIDWEKIRILVDGKDYSKSAGHFSYDMDGTVSLSGLTWADGTHQATFIVPDKYGNQGIKTVYFTVNTGSAKLALSKKHEQAFLGDVFELSIKATNVSEITGASIKLQVDQNFPVENVTFSNGFKTSTSKYDALTGILTLNLVNSGETAAEAEVATIPIRIPASTKEGSKAAYEIVEANLAYNVPKEESFISTFSMRPESADVKGAFNLKADPVLIGKPSMITVINDKNEAVSGAEVFVLIEGSEVPVLLGNTDDKGSLVVDAITNEVKKIALFAVKDGKYSFNMNTQTYPPLAAATEIKNIISNPTGNPYQEKAFSWMSSPLAKDQTVIQFAEKMDFDTKGEQSLETVKGTSSNQVFSGEQDPLKNGIVRVNAVTLKNLKQDTTYVYRVGDGENWSDIQEFSTLKYQESFEFAILGDTQSPADLSDFSKILGDLNNRDLSFMIHVGDLIDESSKFYQWDGALKVLSQYSNIRATDFVVDLGNHEYMGDPDAQLARAIFNLPKNGPDADKGGTYSVDYHNLHISVIGYTDSAEVLDKQLEWLKQDVKESNKPWKILVTHKPPYYTNPFGGNEIMKQKLPPVVDELGIDVVFSGHDHAYGRTKKLKAGQEDPNGAVYMVTGTTGKKHYDAIADEKFEFVNMDNIAISIRAKVDKDQITFTTVTSDGETLDQFTIRNEISPVGQGFTATIDENAANDTEVGTVSATDENGNSHLDYRITAGNDEGAFAIDSSTGKVTVADSSKLDYETIQSFSLTVQVSDGIFTTEVLVNISLNNLNDNAPTVKDENYSIDENAANGTTVGIVEAADADQDPLSYRFISGNEMGAFGIDEATGKIVVADSRKLDYEKVESFTLKIQVSDGVHIAKSNVTIHLNNLNDHTPIADDASFTIDEKTENGTVVGTVKASDADGDALTYKISSGNNEGTFAINEKTGEITVADAAKLHAAAKAVYTLSILVSDGQHEKTITITINVISSDVPRLQKEVRVTPVKDGVNATVSDDQINQLDEEGTLVVELKMGLDEVTTIQFTAGQLETLINRRAKIKIVKDDVELLVDAANFAKGENLVISMERVAKTPEKLPSSNLVAGAVYDFTIKQGDNIISHFAHEIQLAFPVSGVEHPEELKVFYWNPDKKEWELIGGTFENGQIKAMTKHLSTYGVFHPNDLVKANPSTEKQVPGTETNKKANPSTEGQLPDTATNMYNWLFAGIILLLMGGTVLFKQRVKQKQ
ncbi:phosphodiester glycosidase family protein [Neobacillus niacini]|uniref:phosphodiester glycosidase family protein n=1 Tax=Neobacillus niacini TaxID=86668 RepID=UPI0021CB0109|nr:phosphodiester glycosidase family protein [Neobacillus niacini]MCM3766299.1 phosphodiester glycosidase family protein [Neobacillus niacini]